MIVYWHNPRINFCQEHTVFPCQLLHMGKYSAGLLHNISSAEDWEEEKWHEKGKKCTSQKNGVNRSVELHSAAGSKETSCVSTLGTWSEKHGCGYGVLSLVSLKYPCMHHAESRKIWKFFPKNPASMTIERLASSFFHSWQTGLFGNSAGRCILKKILLNNTWQIFYSLRNAVTQCSYTTAG